MVGTGYAERELPWWAQAERARARARARAEREPPWWAHELALVGTGARASAQEARDRARENEDETKARHARRGERTPTDRVALYKDAVASWTHGIAVHCNAMRHTSVGGAVLVQCWSRSSSAGGFIRRVAM